MRRDLHRMLLGITYLIIAALPVGILSMSGLIFRHVYDAAVQVMELNTIQSM